MTTSRITSRIKQTENLDRHRDDVLEVLHSRGAVAVAQRAHREECEKKIASVLLKRGRRWGREGMAHRGEGEKKNAPAARGEECQQSRQQYIQPLTFQILCAYRSTCTQRG